MGEERHDEEGEQYWQMELKHRAVAEAGLQARLDHRGKADRDSAGCRIDEQPDAARDDVVETIRAGPGAFQEVDREREAEEAFPGAGVS